MNKKKVVVIGGGTGTHTVLRGLRHYADSLDIAAIVSMADSGGSTGRLRDEFGFLPIGDARNALTALASQGDKYDDLMRQLFLYRFAKGGGLEGHNFGNLFLTALTDILGSEVAAIEAASHILQVSGRVIPVTTDNVQLAAKYDDGTVVVGENEIEEAVAHKENSRIVSLWLTPEATITFEAMTAIKEADLIVLGPGDLYTSVLANCVVKGFTDALRESKAHIVYVCNLMSKRGQTVGMHAAEHVSEIQKHIGRAPDTALINTATFSEDLLLKYQAEGDHPILNNCLGDVCTIQAESFAAREVVTLSSGDIVKRSLIRHDCDVLATVLLKILNTA
jgi:uncharacterized cofD-like protein